MRKRLTRAAALALGLALLAFGSERSVSLRAFVEAVNVEDAVLRVDSYDVHVGESGVRGHVRSLEEVQPGLFARVRGDTPKVVNFFYGNHSTNKVRKRNQEEEIAWHYRDFSALPIDAGDYQQRMVAWTLKAAEHDFEEGRREVARKEFERVLCIRPDDETAREYLAKLDKKKETKEAEKKGS